MLVSWLRPERWVAGCAVRVDWRDGTHDLACFRASPRLAGRALGGLTRFWAGGPYRPLGVSVVVVSYRDFRLHARRWECRAPDCPTAVLEVLPAACGRSGEAAR
jgi:hypothetical protein